MSENILEKSFLYRIAEKYYQTYGNEIHGFSFVFPNRRAGLFFQKYLTQVVQQPIFSPEIMTINDCFAQAAEYQTADRLNVLFRLYKLYIDKTGRDETFDHFVFWGEMLLSDFNEIDKYMVNAEQLFSNISDLKSLDDSFDYLSEEQKKVIEHFWKDFKLIAENNATRDQFIATWDILNDLYVELCNSLVADGIATEGMQLRMVANMLKNGSLPEAFVGKKFVFVGFNALNPCERTLMLELQKRDMTDFYWDYESEMLSDSDNPASTFRAENLSVFGSKFDIAQNLELESPKNFELIAVPSSVGQAKQVHQLLSQIQNKEWINTAVVLPDETLLLPLIHSLPDSIDKINVTMGYPLSTTPVAGLIDALFDLQRKTRVNANKTGFYHSSVLNVLQHQYISVLCADDVDKIKSIMVQNNWIYVEKEAFENNPLLCLIFTVETDAYNFLTYLSNVLLKIQEMMLQKENALTKFRLELDFLYQYYISIQRITDICADAKWRVAMTVDTMMRLLRQLFATVSVPFVGEPLAGLQIMGMLETRGLDFENLIICSFNEGVFPAKQSANSFIPYNLRKGFGLPTYEYHDSIFSYNFYRLIHRAKNIYFLYDTRTDGQKSGELSRFYHQLYYHYGIEFKRKNIHYNVVFSESNKIDIVKTKALQEKLAQYIGENATRALSASGINTYIDCPLKFYYSEIEKMAQSDEVKETVEENMFGTIFHKAVELIYKPYVGRLLQYGELDNTIKDTHYIDKCIVQAFAQEFFKARKPESIVLEGNNLLIARVLRKYIVQMLRLDATQLPLRYIGSEAKCETFIDSAFGKVKLKGYIDRVDEKDGIVRIMDYKTGGGSLQFKSWEQVFDKTDEKRPKYVLQTFMYGLLYKQYAQNKQMTPGIYYIRNFFKSDFGTTLSMQPDKDTRIDIEDYAKYEVDFLNELQTCINEIFDPELKFSQTENQQKCSYCTYKELCNR